MATIESHNDIFADAQWLRDPVFDGTPIINCFQKEDAPKPELSGPQNVHTLFRKQVELSQAPAKVVACLTADDYFKLYINGSFVTQGPESGYPFAYPYYILDLTGFFQQGVNCLAAHVFYQGLYNRVWTSADNRSGFIMTLDVTYPDGAAHRFVTDDSWKFMTLDGFPTGRTIGYDTQFAEDIDLRRIPKGWRGAGFDDSGWGTPLIGKQDHEFMPQITPALEIRRVEPIVAKDKGDGRYFYDFGTEITGHTRIRITGPAGHKLCVRHGEELSAPEEVRFEMRAGCEYQEFPILAEGDNTVEFFDYRAFRYMEILDAPSEPEVWVDVRHHPFDPAAAQLHASDQGLTAIWEMCKNGVRYGCQGGFLDCPTREKGQYLGDALITSHSHLLLTGDPTLSKKAIYDFHLSQRICPGIMAVAPSSFMQEIAEYSLQWPIVLRNYYWNTGDRAFVEQMVDAAFGKLYAYFAKYETEAGLLSGMDEKWVLVDWPKNLRDDYDYDYAEKIENTVLNAFYYASLTTAAGLLRDLGRDGAAYEAKAERVKKAFADLLLDSETGLFVDAPGSKHSALHANAIPLCFGLVAPENVPNVVQLIREKRLSCGVYIAPFIIAACFNAGEPGLGYDLITSHDEHSWHEMLKHGATTCLEAWGPDQKWNTSWCHPWSSSPIFLIAERVMGLMPAEPGWKAVHFAPNVPETLDWAMITVPTPQGWATARCLDGKCTITVSPGTTVQAELPNGQAADVKEAVSHARGVLSAEQSAFLDAQGWQEHAGRGRGVWVSVDDQMLRIIEDGRLIWQAQCSTAANGTGSEKDSFKTPLGWHRIAEKIGAGAPWGQVFRSKKPSGKPWRPGQKTEEDLVLSRVLVLAGQEEGKNKGGAVDSFERCIYIHGTNDEENIGKPTSHGCVRLTNDDVLLTFERVSEELPVLITYTEGNA